MKTLAVFLVFFKVTTGILYSQEPVRFFVTYDPFKALINEHSVTVGYNISNHHLIALSLGYNYANESLRESIIRLSPSQDKYPVLVYTGPVIRVAYGYRFSSFFYVGADIGYKYLQYSNHRFTDQNGKDGMVRYTRDEKTNVLVGHVNAGFLLTIPHTHIILNPVIGIGGKVKFRNYTTSNVEESSDASFDISPGTFSKTQSDISFLMSMNVGFRIGK